MPMMIGMQKMLRQTIEIAHAVVSLMMILLLLRRVRSCSLWRSQREVGRCGADKVIGFVPFGVKVVAFEVPY